MDDVVRISGGNATRSPSGLALVDEGMLRIAPALPLPGLLAERGLDARRIIAEAGVHPELFDDPENTISFADMGRLLVHCAEVTGAQHLGLEIGQRSGLEALGIIGRLSLHAPNLSAALRSIVFYLHLHDRGAVPALWELGDQAMFGYVIHRPDVPGTDQIYAGATAIIFNILKSLVGTDWTASEIWVCCPKPADTTAYQRLFRCPLRFSAPRAAVAFRARDLARPLTTADSVAYERIRDEVEALAALDGLGLGDRVRQVLRRLIVRGIEAGEPKLGRVAGFFAIHGRTLNRRLSEEGTTYKALVAEVRFEMARQLLRDTSLPMIEVAAALGYGDTSAFSRAFSGWSGSSPSAWRHANRSESG